jgi:GDP-L-fucose synthase
MNSIACKDYFTAKKVLVAGGTGVIGIPTVRRLVELGAHVEVVSTDTEWYAARVLPTSVDFRRFDLTSFEACLEASKGKQVVFNLVGIKGSTGIGETKVASYLVPMLWFQTNMMEEAFRNGAERFLFASSICGYPESKHPKREESFWNGLPKQNDRIPGLAKRIGEVQGEAYLKEHGWEAVRIVRPSNVFGPYDDFDPRTAQVIPALIRRLLDGENPLSIWGDGSVVRDFVFSEDVAEWIIEVVARGPVCRPLNLGSGIGLTLRELAEVIINTIAPGTPICWDPEKPTGDPVRILSMEQTDRILGPLHHTPLTEGIARTANWYKDFNKG